MNGAKDLAKLIGAKKVLTGPKDLARVSRDFAGHDLGRALCVVRPASTEDVRQVVLWARRTKTALTPCGALTSFWASTRVPGRVALDMRGMAKLISVDPLEGVARAQAGMSVSAFDAALGKKGLTLAGAPDGFGDAVLGTLAANDTVAGLGQYAGPASGQLVGLEAVLGSGEVLRTGASSALAGLPAFSREGLPDPTGLFLASEGTLGVITEVVLRVRPRPCRETWSAPVPSTPDAFERLSAAARGLRAAAGVERILLESWVTMRGDSVLVDLAAEDEAGLRARSERVAAEWKRHGLPALTRGETGPRWGERPLGKENWRGVSLQVPHGNIAKVYGLWLGELRGRVAGIASPEGFLRIYLNAYGCASLFGWSFPTGEAVEARSSELERALRARLGPLGIPYRAGTVWRAALDGRLDPAYASVLRDVKARFDPDGILNPGTGVVDSAARSGSRR